MRKSILLFFFIPIYSAFGQTYSTVISDKEIIDFINADIERDSIKTKKPIRQNFWIPDKEYFYYSDSSDFIRKNNSFPPLFIFTKHIHNGKVYTNNLDSVFTRSDIDYFLLQIEGFTTQKEWVKPFKKSYLIKENEMTDEDDYHKVKDGKTVYIYSLPIFSLDKTKAIIIKGFFCGFLCGGQSFCLYSLNEKNKWEMIKEFNVSAE